MSADTQPRACSYASRKKKLQKTGRPSTCALRAGCRFARKIPVPRVGADGLLRRSLRNGDPRRVVPETEIDMKRTTIIFSALLLGMSGAAAADKGRAREFFRQLDANGDRKIAFGEIAAARAKLFDGMDADRNEVLDPGEMQSATKRMTAGRESARDAQLVDLQTRKAEMDKNRDGRISRDEFAGFIPSRLAKADVNGDRILSLAELRSLRRQ
jgi:Ca2+-binding EF-hand superfamily protein